MNDKNTACGFCHQPISKRTLQRHFTECAEIPKIDAGEHICSTCQTIKKLSAFSVKTTNMTSNHICKECSLSNYKKWRAERKGKPTKNNNPEHERPGRWVLHPCKYCGEMFNFRGMRLHVRRCDKSTSKRYRIADDGVIKDQSNTLDEHKETHSTAYQRSRNLKMYYGITIFDYNKMLVEQNGVCAICLQPPIDTGNHRTNRLHVDHCHETGNIRGLLCYQCNHAVGNIRESADICDRLKAYIVDKCAPHKNLS